MSLKLVSQPVAKWLIFEIGKKRYEKQGAYIGVTKEGAARI